MGTTLREAASNRVIHTLALTSTAHQFSYESINCIDKQFMFRFPTGEYYAAASRYTADGLVALNDSDLVELVNTVLENSVYTFGNN